MLTTTAPGACADTPSRASANPITAIDAHAHVFSRDLPLAQRRRYAPAYDAQLAHYLAQLDAHDVSHGVLIQPSFLGTDNSYLVQSIAKAPGRLRGIAAVDPNDIAKAPGELDTLARAGVVGIRLNLFSLPDPDYTSAAWQTTLAKIAELGWQIEVHCEAERLAQVVGPLLACTGGVIDVVVDHFGRPQPMLGVDDPGFRYLLSLGHTRRVWVKVSGAYRNARIGGVNPNGSETALAAMALLQSAYGLDRLVWGSDWPHTQFEEREGYDAVYAFMLELLPTERERRAVLIDTPASLFRFV